MLRYASYFNHLLNINIMSIQSQAILNNQLFLGDCRQVLATFPPHSIAACLTDPPYNYEFIGHKWDATESARRVERVQHSKTLVKHIPYGSGLAGGVRNAQWYQRVRANIQEYQDWCFEWATEIFRVCKPGAIVAAFNSTRTLAHLQIAFERAGFYTRDCIVYRRASGIPKGLNLKAKLAQKGASDADNWEGWHSCLRNEWEAIVVVQKPLCNNYLETVRQYGVGLFHTANPDGSFQSNILENIPRDKDKSENFHFTVKPLALMEKLIAMFVPPSPENLILDPFAGSGTTLVAAQKLAYNYVGIEIVPEYREIARRRLARQVAQTNSIAQSCTPMLW